MRLDREEFKRIIKFGVTGAANTLIDFGVYTLLAFRRAWIERAVFTGVRLFGGDA